MLDRIIKRLKPKEPLKDVIDKKYVVESNGKIKTCGKSLVEQLIERRRQV